MPKRALRGQDPSRTWSDLGAQNNQKASPRLVPTTFRHNISAPLQSAWLSGRRPWRTTSPSRDRWLSQSAPGIHTSITGTRRRIQQGLTRLLISWQFIPHVGAKERISNDSEHGGTGDHSGQGRCNAGKERQPDHRERCGQRGPQPAHNAETRPARTRSAVSPRTSGGTSSGQTMSPPAIAGGRGRCRSRETSVAGSQRSATLWRRSP